MMVERFSASVAARIMECPASANLELAIAGYVAPVEDRTANNAANRGTRKHEMLEPMVRELNATDLRHMATFLNYVADVRGKRRWSTILVEEKVKATWLQTQPPTTADYVFATSDELHILDGKWGKILVPVLDNVQLLFYAACYAHLAPKAKQVTVHILQPYADNYEAWVISSVVLREFMDKAIAAEKKILQQDLTFGVSDHCKFCPANPHSRGAKGSHFCPEMLTLLGYGDKTNEDEILAGP